MNDSQKKRAKKLAGEIIVDEINSFLDASESPVDGGRFKSTLKNGEPCELFEFGDMRDAIKFKALDTDHIEVGIFEKAPKLQREKAYGHNSGFVGHPNESKMKKYKREFIPATNKRFKDEIMDRVNDALDDIRGEVDTRKVDRELESIVGEILDDTFGGVDGEN